MKKRIVYSFIFLFTIFITCNRMTQHAAAAGTAADVVNVAVSQIGYQEKASNANLDDKTANKGSGNYNRYARDIGVANGQPWCATFVWWCMQTAGVPEDKYPRVTYATRDWFRSRGLWHDRGTYTPKPGDYVAFGTAPDHCGIVRSVSGGNFTTIEGNTSDSVASRSWALNDSYVMGFGEIRYSGNIVVDTSNPGFPYGIPSGIIGQGSSGDGTRWIQTALNNLIGAGLSVDGIFGADTKNAVIRFQSANGLTADGVVGNDTRNKMIAVWQSKQDTVKPVIKNVKISAKNSTCYRIECDVSDNVGVTKVQFPTWTIKNNQDDLKWVNATISNGHASAWINIAEHNYEAGPYITHAYAWDAANNQAFSDVGVIKLPQISDGVRQDLGNSFTAMITMSDSEALTQSNDKIGVKALSENNRTQQWNFTRNDDGTYFINNLANNLNIDLLGNNDTDGCTVHTYEVNGSDAQKWYIYKTSSGKFYFVPKKSQYRVMDIGVSTGIAQLWAFAEASNQLFGLRMVIDNTIVSPSPVLTKAPDISIVDPTDIPIVTEVPIASEQPATTEVPMPSGQPIVTEAPIASEQPVVTEVPMPSGQPIVTETPIASEQPIVTEVPTVTKQPIQTVVPTATKRPLQTAKPFETKVPTVVNESEEMSRPMQVKSVSVKNKRHNELIVRWKKVTGVSGYQIQYARNKRFTVQCTTKNVGAKSSQNINKKFKKGKKYYIRIRAYYRSYNGRVYGKWSKTKKIRIKN